MRTLARIVARHVCEGNSPPVLLAFHGDSVTHGCFECDMNAQGKIFGVCEQEPAYPAQLKRHLDALYPYAAVGILNTAIGGEDAISGAKRLARDVLAHKPDLVVLAYGLNDAMCPDVEEGLRRYQKAMDEMMKAVLASGAECIVQTPNYMCKTVSDSIQTPGLIKIAVRATKVQNKGVLARYAQVVRDLAKENGVPVSDAYARWKQLEEDGADTTEMLANGINHPTREAHAIFVETLMEALQR